MRALTCFALLAGMVTATQAGAYEYPLQFSPNPGARGLVVAGYQFGGNTVIGNCSYYTVHGGSGRGGGYHSTTTYYNQTCTWDLYGNLLGIAQGAPTIPAPIGTSGTAIIYAQNGQGGSTGSDPRLYGGFVNTVGAHFTWVTANGYVVLQNQKPISVPLTLVSDGDVPLVSVKAEAGALLARASVKQTTCIKAVAVGATCTVTVLFDPSRLSSASGLAYDTLTVSLVDNAGQSLDFVQRYTIVVSTGGDDGGGD